jgi:ATP-dependent HslUV protease subunit HslV
MSRLTHSTTVLGLIHKGKACIGADGQVTFGETIAKHTARKVRKIYNNKVLIGFAGGVADAITLSEKMEEKLEEYHGNLPKAAVELGREWRSDKVLRRLDAIIAVLDNEHAYILTGEGDIIEPENKIVTIGSGGPYAYAAARALVENTDLDARKICEKALKIAASICIYTNDQITILEL